MNSTLTSLIEPLGWALLHFLWQAAVIALLLRGFLWLVRRRSPQIRYAAAGAALLMMLGAASTTVWWQARGSDGRNGKHGTQVAPVPVSHSSYSSYSSPPPPSPPLPAADSAAEEPAPAPASITASAIPDASLSAVARLRPFLPWMVGIWAAGVAFFSLRLLNGWRVTTRWRATGSDAIPGDWQEHFSRLCQRLRLTRPVRLLSSASLAVPVVIGWLKPVVLVPAGLFTGLSSAQLEALLAHELAHVKRHDYLVNLLQNMLETLFFYHPAVWWVSSKLRQEREHCCDDMATALSGGVLDYARALTALEEMRGVPGMLSVSAAGGSLLQRIRRLAGITEDRASGIAWPLGLVTFAAAAIALPFTLLSAGSPPGPGPAGSSAEKAPAAAPDAKHEQTAALLKLWHEEYKDSPTVPVEARRRLATQVKEYIEKYPGEPAEKMKPLLPELEKDRPWSWDQARETLDTLCDAATAPVGWQELHEQFRAFDRVKPGTAGPEDQLAKLPFGPPASNGLRAAWIFAPMQDTYAVGDVLKCRIIIHNNGKEAVEFRTDQWHQNDKWRVKNAAGEEVKVKTTWYTGLTPYQRFKLEPGQTCEVSAHGVGIGDGKYEENYSTGSIGAEIPAKPGDELTCQWDVSLEPAWRKDPNGQPPANAPPPSLTTGAVTFKVTAANPDAAPKVGIARGTGKYELALGIKLQVSQLTSGKDGEPTSRINTATIEWYAGNGQLGLKWPVELMHGLKIDTIIWKRGGTALWIVHENAVRKIDFANAADVKEQNWKWDAAGDFGGAPPEVRLEIEKFRPKIAQGPLPSAILQFRFVADREGPDTEPMEPMENWSDLPTFHLRKAVILTAADVKSAAAELDKASGRWQINLVFSEEGAAALAKATKENPGRQLAIVGNGKVISAPVIQGEMGKQVMLSGNYLEVEAKALASAIQTAASASLTAGDPLTKSNTWETIIDIAKDGSVSLGGKSLLLEELRGRLSEIGKSNPHQAVIIRGDEETAYWRMIEVFNLTIEAGLKTVSLATTAWSTKASEAAAVANAVREAYDENARRLLDSGRSMEATNPEEARKTLTQIAGLLGNPDDPGFAPENRLLLAEAQFALGSMDARQAGTQSPANPKNSVSARQFLDSAIKRHTHGIKLLLGYDKEHPKSGPCRTLLAQGYMELGQFYSRKGETSDASVAFAASVKLYTELIKEQPVDSGHARGLALAYNEVAAGICSAKPGTEGAREALEYQKHSVKLMREAHTKHPQDTDVQFRLAAFILHNGELHETAGDTAAAGDRFAEVLTITAALLDDKSVSAAERKAAHSLSDQAKAKMAPDAQTEGDKNSPAPLERDSQPNAIPGKSSSPGEPKSGKAKVDKNPPLSGEDITTMLKTAAETAQAFFKATTAEEKMKFLLLTDESRKLLSDFYQRHPAAAITDAKLIQSEVFQSGHAALMFDSPSLARSLWIDAIEKDGRVLLAWETCSIFQQEFFKDIQADMPKTPVRMLAKVEHDDYYNAGLADAKRYQCYRLTWYGTDTLFYGYADRTSEAFAALEKLVRLKGQRATMEIKYPADAKFKNQVEIVRVQRPANVDGQNGEISPSTEAAETTPAPEPTPAKDNKKDAKPSESVPRIIQHKDGTRTEVIMKDKDIHESTFSKDGVLTNRRFFITGSRGRLRRGVIYDGNKNPLGSVEFGYDKAKDELVEERHFNAKGQLIRRVFYPGALKHEESAGRFVAYDYDPDNPRAKPGRFFKDVRPTRVVTESEEPVPPPKPPTLQTVDAFAVPDDPEKFAEARRKGIMVNVLDTTGQKPIPEFRIIAGVRSQAGGEKDRDVVNWQPHTLHTGKNGGLIWPLDKAYDEMALRVEADGYEPQMFAWIKKSEGAKDLYFQLVESKGTSGRVLTPDGKPAAGATVALAMVQRDAVIEKGKLRHLDEPAPEKPGDRWRWPRFVKTDADGRFQLPPENDPTAAVLIVHDSGVREMPLADFKKTPDVTLQAWGRLEGHVQWGDKAGADQKVSLTIHRDSFGYPGVIAQYEKTKAAADGSFVFERVLPGRAQLSCPISAEAGNKSGTTEINFTGQIAHITVQPGVTPAVIGGAGRTVKGKLTGRDSWDGVTFHFHPRAPHVGSPGDDEMWKAWGELQKGPSGPLLFRNGLPVNADGTFEIPNVLPGDYQIFFSHKGEEGHIASGQFSVEAETPVQKPEAQTLPEMKAR